MNQYEKVDANTLRIIKERVLEPLVETYVYQDVLARHNQLIEQKAAFNSAIDAQIAEAKAAVDAADGFGLTPFFPKDDVVEDAEAAVTPR